MEPTHKISLYGVRCYFNEHTDEIMGVNWFFDKLVIPVCGLHNLFVTIGEYTIPGFEHEAGFPLKVIEDYSEEKWQ